MIELTKQQLETLENVFNWALNEKGEFEAVSQKTEEKKIIDLFNVMKKHVCLKKPAKDRLDVSYIIKAKSGKETLYFDAVKREWTTIVFGTKFYSKKEAQREKDKISSDWMRDIEVAKCKTEEI